MIPTHADPIQNEIEEKGLNAPRVRPEDLEAEILAETYFTAADGATASGEAYHDSLACLTFCVLVLKNGFTTVGYTKCVSPENFDAEIGKKIARKNALRQLWPLLGFRLADRIADGENPIFRAP
jgi:hypothetical protein